MTAAFDRPSVAEALAERPSAATSSKGPAPGATGRAGGPGSQRGAGSPPSPIGDLVETRSIVICCGAGGVGKTTVSAALALQAARQGRRACVVTIDPARRLASALGIDQLANDPVQLAGDWPGQLWAVMLDPKRTFDDLVRQHAGDSRQAEAILANRIYRNLTGALSGTQEYMAMEKVHQLTESGQFDLVVVDTPPTRNAIDFIDAPRRLTRFLGHRLFQLLLMPTKAYMRAVSVASQALLRSIAKVAGSDVVEDAVAFFNAFEGMEEGFRSRAEHMQSVLGAPATSFVLVTSPRSDTVTEATWFAGQLADLGFAVSALVVNRVQPDYRAQGPLPEAPPASVLMALEHNLEELHRRRRHEERAIAGIVSDVAPASVVLVPVLDEDVHDVEGLSAVARSLVAGSDGRSR